MIIYAADDSEEFDVKIKFSDFDVSSTVDHYLHNSITVYPGDDYKSTGNKRVMVFDPCIISDDSRECIIKARLEINGWDPSNPLSEGAVLFDDKVEIPVDVEE